MPIAPPIELTSTIRPPACSRMVGSTCLTTRTQPQKLVSSWALASSMAERSAAPASPQPAAAIIMEGGVAGGRQGGQPKAARGSGYSRSSCRATIDWCAGRAATMSLDVIVRGITIPADELTWRFSRSPGPGGQSVNTADTRVELSYDLAASTALPEPLKRRALGALGGRLTNGVLTVTAAEYRSQLRNREAAAAPLAE